MNSCLNKSEKGIWRGEYNYTWRDGDTKAMSRIQSK